MDTKEATVQIVTAMIQSEMILPRGASTDINSNRVDDVCSAFQRIYETIAKYSD